MNIFISHIHEEEALAIAVKSQLEKCFGGQIRLFLAEDIPLGRNWFSEIKEALRAADLILALFSPASQLRPWVNIEAGFGIMSEKRVVPVCCLGLAPTDLPVVYGLQQAMMIDDRAGVERLLEEIAKLTPAGRLLTSKFQSAMEWVAAVEEATAALPSYAAVPSEPPFVWVMGSGADLSTEESRLSYKVVDILAPAFLENGYRIVIGRTRLLSYLGDKIAAGGITQDQTLGHREPVLERLSIESVRAQMDSSIPNPVVILGRLGSSRGVRHMFLHAVGRVPDVAVVIGGSPGGHVSKEIQFAKAAKIPVLPLPFTGGTAANVECSFDPSMSERISAVQKPRRMDELGTTVCELIQEQVILSRQLSQFPRK